MSLPVRRLKRAGLIVAAIATPGWLVCGYALQDTAATLPNPYRTVENWAKMPEGRTWGATSAVDIDPDGTSIWVAERCGAEHLLGPRSRQDLAARRGPEVRCQRQAGKELWRRDVHLPARDPCRSRRQYLGHRRAGQPAATRSRRGRGCAAAAAAREGHRPPGLQVQPGRQTADHAWKGRRQSAR